MKKEKRKRKKPTHNEIIERMIKDRKFRIALTKKSHYWFFHFYFRHYVTFRTADFHREMFRITEDEEITTAVIVAFRGSGKSTIFTLSYVLWSILGKQNKKFVVITSQTQRQARQQLINIKKELENNTQLRRDLGPFHEESDEWGGYSLVISNYEARISAASAEQSIRGIRHLQSRPNLIIADDVEDLQSVRNQEGRNKTYDWFKGDVIPAGEKKTKIIVVGNLLHEDSLLRRLQKEIEEDKLNGIYREFPLVDKNGKSLWPDKFPTGEEIEKEKKKIGNEIAWQREYMLKIIPDKDIVIHPDWMNYYETLPDIEDDENRYLYAVTAIDLAISQKNSAHFTAMVSARAYWQDGGIKIYILPYPVNERLTFPETVERAKEISKDLGGEVPTKIWIEEVGYQKSIIQELQTEGYPAEGVSVMGQDKRARLQITTSYLKNGKILFPRQGCDVLIQQLVGFGVEKYDDLADAFSMLIGKIIAEDEYVSEFPEQVNDPESRPITAGLMDEEF